jgi:hypothetical protein
VTADDRLLRCGRTLAEVVALVVRAAARRIFRARLSPGPGRPRADSASERLYRVLRDYLRFDWQVLLIPHYAPLTPERAAALGERLLDVREPAELRALADDEPADHGRPPLLLDTALRVLTRGHDSIDSEVLWLVCQQMDLARLFPKGDAIQLRHAVAQVAATQSAAIAALVPVVGGDIRRFTAFLMVAYVTLGEARYRQSFGADGQVAALRRWAERLAEAEVPPPRLEDFKRVYGKVLSTAATEPTAVAEWAGAGA